jgi:HEAT repeat protein
MLRLSLLILLFNLTSNAQEPSFNGRTLSEWQTILKEDATPRKRRAAVIALGQISTNSKDSLPQIVLTISKALRSDPAVAVREEASSFLNQQKVDEVLIAALPDLVESVRIEREVSVKKQVTVVIGRCGKFARSAVPPLITNLKDTDSGVRAATADALGRIGPDAKSAASTLLIMLGEKETPVRLSVVFALGRIDPDEQSKVAAALIEVINGDKDAATRKEGIISLGLLGLETPEIVTVIAKQLREKDPEIRLSAAQTLSKFKRRHDFIFADLQQGFKSDPDKVVRQTLIRALTTASPADQASLIQLFSQQLAADSDFEVRIAIAEELGTFGPTGKPALPALRNAQRDSQVKVREAAARAIKAIEKPVTPPKP